MPLRHASLQRFGWQLVILSGFLLLGPPANADWEFEVPSSSSVQHLDLSVPENISLTEERALRLVEEGAPDDPIVAQLIPAIAEDGQMSPTRQRLLATILPRDTKGTNRRFRVQVVAAPESESPFHFVDTEQQSLKLLEANSPIFVYNYGTITNPDVPESDSRRARGCYIHPVWGINGEVLTADFPADHYHHHGIFWAWPYVRINDATYDLWEYRNIQQRFVQWLYRETGPVAAVLGVENGWFVGDRQVLTERVWLRVYKTQAEGRSIDCSIVLNAGNDPVTLQGREDKSYGGLVFRFDVWPRHDAHVRVSGRTLRHEGKELLSPQDLSNTPLAWVDLTSRFPGTAARSGAAIFIHPSHPDYPPTWLTRAYGPQCVGWPGVKPYTLKPGTPIDLQYRFWIHSDEQESDDIEQRYESYKQVADQLQDPQ